MTPQLKWVKMATKVTVSTNFERVKWPTNGGGGKLGRAGGPPPILETWIYGFLPAPVKLVRHIATKHSGFLVQNASWHLVFSPGPVTSKVIPENFGIVSLGKRWNSPWEEPWHCELSNWQFSIDRLWHWSVSGNILLAMKMSMNNKIDADWVMPEHLIHSCLFCVRDKDKGAEKKQEAVRHIQRVWLRMFHLHGCSTGNSLPAGHHHRAVQT